MFIKLTLWVYDGKCEETAVNILTIRYYTWHENKEITSISCSDDSYFAVIEKPDEIRELIHNELRYLSSTLFKNLRNSSISTEEKQDLSKIDKTTLDDRN